MALNIQIPPDTLPEVDPSIAEEAIQLAAQLLQKAESVTEIE